MVRPRCELELADLPLLTGAILQREKSAKSDVRYRHTAPRRLRRSWRAAIARPRGKPGAGEVYLVKGERSDAEGGQFDGIE